jgi:hypothetical protein
MFQLYFLIRNHISVKVEKLIMYFFGFILLVIKRVDKVRFSHPIQPTFTTAKMQSAFCHFAFVEEFS